MTNEEIILNNRVFLMEEGVIEPTDEKFVFTDDNGAREIFMPEEIHTFKAWKDMGYSVRKGEHSVARFPIWQIAKKKNKSKKDDDQNQKDDENGYYYMKVAFFFTRKQVEKIGG